MLYRAFIEAPYDQLVRRNTKFWNTSGLDLQIDTEGVRIDTESVLTLLMGGISFEPTYRVLVGFDDPGGLQSGAPAKIAGVQIGKVDSIVIDPHKHGLQPYGCGCVLFSDPGVGRFYKHDSPYTYFSSPDLHL